MVEVWKGRWGSSRHSLSLCTPLKRSSRLNWKLAKGTSASAGGGRQEVEETEEEEREREHTRVGRRGAERMR